MGWNGYLDLEPLMTLWVKLASPSVPGRYKPDRDAFYVGSGPYGSRRVFSASEGGFKFLGRGLQDIEGVLVPGPADYALRDTKDDAKARYLTVDVRGVLLAKDAGRDFAIYMHYSSCIEFTARMVDAIVHGKGLTRKESRFITTPRFEVGSYEGEADSNKDEPLPPHILRLNTIVAVAHGELTRGRVDYEVYEVVNRKAPGS